MGSVDFCFAEYEIDLARQELRRAGEAVAIEPQVFDVLVYLVQNRDRIVIQELDGLCAPEPLQAPPA